MSGLFDDILHKKEKKRAPEKGAIYDYTDLFLNFLDSVIDMHNFGGIIWAIGGPGAGKTCLMFCFQNHIFEVNQERNVSFYQAPDAILKAIKKSAPKKIYNRYRIIDKLHEVENLDIFSLDEGYLSANALDALTKDSNNFMKSITTLRHQGVITWLNSLDDGILKGFRKKAQFQFFKLLPHGFIEESNISFLKKNQEIVSSLFPEQSLFRISHHMFVKAGIIQGILDLHKDIYCPWFTDEISTSFENEGFDAEYRREKQKQKRMEKIIKMVMNVFGDRLTKAKASTLVEGYLLDELPEVWWEFKNDINRIIKIAYWRLKKPEIIKGKIKKKESNNSIETPELVYSIEDELKCAHFFRDFYNKNLPQYKDSLGSNWNVLPQLFYLWILGNPQKKLQHETNMGLNMVNKYLQLFNLGKFQNQSLPDDELRLCYCYEHYIAMEKGAVRDGRRSVPDLLFYGNKKNILGPGECKLYYENTKSVSYDIGKDLKPSYEYCLDHNLRFFPLFFRNPISYWGNYDLIIKVDCNPSRTARFPMRLTITNKMIKESHQDFLKFNKIEFFNENNKITERG